MAQFQRTLSPIISIHPEGYPSNQRDRIPVSCVRKKAWRWSPHRKYQKWQKATKHYWIHTQLLPKINKQNALQKKEKGTTTRIRCVPQCTNWKTQKGKKHRDLYVALNLSCMGFLPTGISARALWNQSARAKFWVEWQNRQAPMVCRPARKPHNPAHPPYSPRPGPQWSQPREKHLHPSLAGYRSLFHTNRELICSANTAHPHIPFPLPPKRKVMGQWVMEQDGHVWTLTAKTASQLLKSRGLCMSSH